MSIVKITDKRGGMFNVVVTFVYGECDRLPFNSLRKVKARIEQIANGGIQAVADFNVRNTRDAANFVEILDLFGEEGSFVHGSSATAEDLQRHTPPEDELDPAIQTARGRAAARNPSPTRGGRAARRSAQRADAEVVGTETAEEPADLVVEEEAERES